MNRKTIIGALVVGTSLLGVGARSASAAFEPVQFNLAQTTRASVATDGTERTQASLAGSVSGNGRLVVFSSDAALVTGDTNGVTDVYLRNRHDGTTQRISVSQGGTQANGSSSEPHISTNGRFVVFTSRASNLASGDTSHTTTQVYVKDLSDGSVRRASISRTGGMPNAASRALDVSDDGQVVVFKSDATDITNDDNNPASDFYVRTGSTNLRLDTQTSGSAIGKADVTPDGRFVAFTSQTRQNGLDANSFADVYRRDLTTGENFLVSRAHTPAGNAASSDPRISSDGSRIAFVSCATNLVSTDTNGHCDIFIRDASSLSFIKITNGNADSENPALSGNGSIVAWDSGATNLVSSDTNGRFDIFSQVVENGNIKRNSIDTHGTPGDRDSLVPSLTSDGNTITWETASTNLVSDDHNSVSDVCVSGVDV